MVSLKYFIYFVLLDYMLVCFCLFSIALFIILVLMFSGGCANFQNKGSKSHIL